MLRSQSRCPAPCEHVDGVMVFNECNKMSEMKMLYRRHVPVFHVRMTRGLGVQSAVPFCTFSVG